MTKSAVIKGTGFLHASLDCPQLHGSDSMEVDPAKMTYKKCHWCYPADMRQIQQREVNNARKGM